MDRAIVISTLLLVGLTWLLYRLTVKLEPGGDKPATGAQDYQKPIHQRLRQ